MKPPVSPERPRHFLVVSHPCVYFGDRNARSQVLHPVERRSPAAYSDLARAGFRRTGDDLSGPQFASGRGGPARALLAYPAGPGPRYREPHSLDLCTRRTVV